MISVTLDPALRESLLDELEVSREALLEAVVDACPRRERRTQTGTLKAVEATIRSVSRTPAGEGVVVTGPAHFVRSVICGATALALDRAETAADELASGSDAPSPEHVGALELAQRWSSVLVAVIDRCASATDGNRIAGLPNDDFDRSTVRRSLRGRLGPR